MGLHIRRDNDLKLTAYCDSDWSGCKETKRSTTGLCTLLGPNLISWSAKRQDTVSSSSTEAEYRALATTTREITWISFLLRDLGIEQLGPTLLQCDNLSAIYLSANPTLHKRSKHFLNDWHFIREQVALGLIETRHISASQQVADIFTKSLPRKAFVELIHKLGVGHLPTPSFRGNISINSMGSRCTSPTEISGPLTSSSLLSKETKQRSQAVRRRPFAETLLDANRFDALSTLSDELSHTAVTSP